MGKKNKHIKLYIYILAGVVILIFISVIFTYINLHELIGLKKEIEENGYPVSLTGKISDTPWQHMISEQEEYPHINYFDLDSGDQYVIYTKEPVLCDGLFEITGKVIKTTGVSKRPDSDEEYSEFQIIVNNFKCLN